MGNERAKVVIYDKIIKLLYANTAINPFFKSTIRVWMVCSELWHHNTDIKCNILRSSWICFQITAHGNNNTLAALTFVSLLDATCRLWQNRFTSFLLCDRTTLKVQKSISQRLQFHTCFCHCAAVWKWSCGSISANYSSCHFHTVNGQTYKEFGATLLVLSCESLSYYGLL